MPRSALLLFHRRLEYERSRPVSIPDWWAFLLLAGGAFRTWKLLAEDDILDRPRRYLLRLGSEWTKEGDPVPDDYRLGWAEFLTCAWCSGAYAVLAWWIAWQIAPHATLVAAVPFALSAAVGIIGQILPSE